MFSNIKNLSYKLILILSILSTSKDFALTASVEKKNIIKARVEKKIYKRLI